METLTQDPRSQGADAHVTCETSQGLELHATILRLGAHDVVFEIYSPSPVLRVSEALDNFSIVLRNRVAYSGRAVITSIVNTGNILVCEANLQDAWLGSELPSMAHQPSELRGEFAAFMRHWEKSYKIRPEFKIIISDLQCFLTDLRLWLEQLELGIRSLPSGNRMNAEHAVVQELSASTTPALAFFFEKFERAAAEIEPELKAANAAFCRRHLHPLLMASPFMHRIYAKPLGYAGDYEMVNMILRDPCEGGSLFAKLLNVFILSQVPAVAHRNRVSYMTKVLVQETSRLRSLGRSIKILNLGCGPAREIQDFLVQYDLSNHAEFELLDFDQETLAHVQQKLSELKRLHSRRTGVVIAKKSVHQVLKNAAKPNTNLRPYDLIYCAGLFDYLNDRACQGLLGYFYNLLAPGGLLLSTNVESTNPIRNIMEYMFEWHLVYRSGSDFITLAPPEAVPEFVSLTADTSSGNLFLEVRKPLTSK
ncbi:MAG TPA: class I SAM-dependent methyltransferase [Verrucomicrobiae bacterium]|nr:class I SAM-dependent methyltransferase [Verrucomicrobiae bacterium]